MNDYNRSGAEIIPIGLLVVIIIIYQNRYQIFNFFLQLLPYVAWTIGIGCGAYLLWHLLRYLYYYLKQKHADWKKWVDDVNGFTQSSKKRLDDHYDWIGSLNSHQCRQDRELEAILAELAKIKEKITPKEEAAKAEASAKTAEAVEQVVRQST
jgi:hypothetical protein